jgi:hypothetical protein
MPISTINTNSIADDAVTVPKVTDQVLSHRNLIINGAMQVAQRGTSAVPVGSATFIVDRFKTIKSNDGAYTIEQSTDAPDGFSTSLKGQVTIADTSLAAGQYAYWPYYIEAKDLQHLSYGTSSAKTLTLSFWVKSSKTGVYTVAVYKQDTTSYMFTHEYTISSANTWENKTITISPTAGSTSFITSSGGAIANDNGAGLILSWNLSFGSGYTGGTSNSWSSTTSDYSTTNAVNWMDSTSNNFYLTGVQLEVGETATPFEHRSYGDELDRCHRYFYKRPADGSGEDDLVVSSDYNNSTSNFWMSFFYPKEMRVRPTYGNASGWVTQSPATIYEGVRWTAFNFTNGGAYLDRSTTFELDAEL